MKEIKGKFIIAFDTICDGWQCAKDENEKPNPTLFDSEADAMKEIFADAIAGLDGTDDDYFEENELNKEETLAEMNIILHLENVEGMRIYFGNKPACNYYDEFIVPAEEFILGRKAIFTGQGIVIAGTKLENL